MDKLLKKLSWLNTQLLRTNNKFFDVNLSSYSLNPRQIHLLKAKEIIKELIQYSNFKKSIITVRLIP